MQITKNFNLNEFTCKDGTPVPDKYKNNVFKLAASLQILRDRLNIKIQVCSGYRTKTYNANLPGAAKRSQHLYGKAADIQVEGKTPEEVKEVVEELIKEKKVHFGGIGIYSNFLHLDIRSTRARW